MLITTLLLVPLLGILAIVTSPFNENNSYNSKVIALATSIFNMLISLFIFIIFDFSSINYQFVQEVHEFNGINIYLGIDGLSIYFVLLTTILIPIVLLSS
jgi:NADH:ubiquinone oxidoreductase subunit 4 (subunit M)